MFDLESIKKMNERIAEHKARQALRNGSAKRAIGTTKTVSVAYAYNPGCACGGCKAYGKGEHKNPE